MHAQVRTFGDTLRLKKDIIVAALAVVVLLASTAFLIGYEEPNEFPPQITEQVDFAGKVNTGEKWLKTNMSWLTRSMAAGVKWALDYVETFLILVPWPVVVLAFALLGDALRDHLDPRLRGR